MCIVILKEVCQKCRILFFIQIQFLKGMFHLQLLQNIGYILHVVQYILVAYFIHNSLYLLISYPNFAPSVFPLPTGNH